MRPEIQEIRREIVTAIKRLGFRGNGTKFCKELEEIRACLQLSKSTYAESFQINVKIFIKRAGEDVQVPHLFEQASVLMGADTKRFGEMLDAEGTLSTNNRADQVAELLAKYVVPAINSLSSEDAIRKFISSKKSTFDFPWRVPVATYQFLEIPFPPGVHLIGE